ncbi:hypothetical protein HY490_03500 [Candidatus Woesearchaeota archaeon]|nr:hypothetical protein [Candidatus Woesearchaeota archaeon]
MSVKSGIVRGFVRMNPRCGEVKEAYRTRIAEYLHDLFYREYHCQAWNGFCG